jgi:hypothetical protein
MIDSPRKRAINEAQLRFPVFDIADERLSVVVTKMPSETDSIGESDSSTISSNLQGQRVFRWSKFVRNLYEMTISVDNAKAVGFSADGLCLEIRDTKLLSSDVLQKYFKHKNVSSFIRQLNNYGFKTIPLVMNSSVAHCFAHDSFRKDRVDLLEGVTRRIAGNNETAKASERAGEMDVEIERRMAQLKTLNEQLKRHNMELVEENKRLKSNWMATQDSRRAVQHDPHRRQFSAPVNEPSFPSFNMENTTEVFMLPTFPALFPEDF